MRVLAMLSVLAVVLTLALSGCAHHDHAEHGCKVCTKAADSGNGWCDHCNKGYSDGKATKCKGCATSDSCAACAKNKK